MADYVSPQVEAAAKSTRTEADVRELARAKARANMALDAQWRTPDVLAKMSEDDRADYELERARLAKAAWEASSALANAI